MTKSGALRVVAVTAAAGEPRHHGRAHESLRIDDLVAEEALMNRTSDMFGGRP
jgi:hypothetical protein